jgi:hypothetical protein
MGRFDQALADREMSFRAASVLHLVETFETGLGLPEEDWGRRVGSLRERWNRASPEEKEDANAWLKWIYDRDRPNSCPLVDLPVWIGCSIPPRGHLAPWAHLPYDWAFYFTERPLICETCADVWAQEPQDCPGCGEPLSSNPDIVTEASRWQAFLGLDLLDSEDGLRLIEINGSNYGLKGYLKLCGSPSSETKWSLFRGSYISPDQERDRFHQYLAWGWLPHRASLLATYPTHSGARGRMLDRLTASKWKQRVLHHDPLPAIRSGMRKRTVLESGHSHYIVKPEDGLQGDGVRVVPRRALKVPRNHIAEPLIPPRGDYVRVLRAGITLADIDDVLHVYHVASYWRRNPLPFDPDEPKSVVTNLAKDAVPELASHVELHELKAWVETWAPHLAATLGFSSYVLHTNFDQIHTREVPPCSGKATCSDA